MKKVQVRSLGAKGTQKAVEAILPVSPEQTVEQVPLKEIDLEDKSFQFRLNLRVGPLTKSIKEHGLQIPVILRASSRLRE